jgi:2-amino-4-hydroxy-6-hydroxymethyldihydropteridine diphosphokinase
VALSQARAVLTALLDQAIFSSLYRTAPQIDLDQEPFWNAAAAGGWGGTPETLLERLLILEGTQGRVRDLLRPKGPRVLDLDLLVFGELVRSGPRLSVPHPGLVLRLFALAPLAELFPVAADPRDGVSWADKARAVRDQGVDRTDRTW